MIITAPPMVGIMDFHDPYMQWYHRITRRFMTPPLHRDDIRFHTTAGITQALVSYSSMFLKVFLSRPNHRLDKSGGTWHGTETPLPELLTLLGPFLNIT